MGAKTIKDIILNSNCDDLMIYHFDKARTTGEYKWLIEGYTGREKVEVNELVLKKAFDDVMNEYCILTGDNRSLEYYELTIEVSNLEFDLNISGALLGTLLTHSSNDTVDEIIQELGHRGFMLNASKPFAEEFERLERQLRQRRTKYNRKKSQLQDLIDVDGDVVSIQKQKISLLRITELREINLKETSVTEWVELQNTAKEILAAKRKASA